MPFLPSSLRKLPLTLSLAVAASALTAQAAQAQSLFELVEQARGYDAPWQSAKAQYDATVSRGQQARAGLLPSVAAQAGVSTAHTQYRVKTPTMTAQNFDLHGPSQQAAIVASQPLFRPANRIAFQQGQRGVEIAQAQLDAADQDLLIRVSQAYFDVLAAQDTLNVVQTQKKAISEQLASAKSNFELGNATITDSREAQARHDLASAQEIAATNDLQVKKLALDQIVGRVGIAPLPLAHPVVLPVVEPSDITQWVDTAESTQPVVRQAQIALDVARLETKKAETGHLPTVDLQASYGMQRNPNGMTSQPFVHSRATSASVGVALNMPLFAGFAVQNRVKETLSLEEKAQADLDNARRNVAQASRAAYLGVQSGMGQVKALEAAVASSQSALDANRLGYQVGVRVNIDILNAQSQLYQTQRDLAKARYDVLMGQLKLRQAAGILGDEDIAKVDGLLMK
ncbi:TolC family outer membrane protein [Diaphorobacter sp. HDW4A]|uniref:TolC family outer membrane protein n=1 Tax=Diaphorobacter sp. HDW4A TaxID=2714924 RepID=UPI00140D03C4|nr:TolC family outer membrane protein [Diaphorobacter sp. HDW4A]QIL80274.1 TolC family outer membrane protein [Diaphorobacter sp. HDW4A]